jgi:hypothetical protein
MGHEDARAHCESLVGLPFRSPKGVLGRFVGVLERPGRPPVVVGKLDSTGTVMHFTPTKGASLVVVGAA